MNTEESLDRSPLLLAREESVLLIVDAQERLLDVINCPVVVYNLERLLAGAEVLQVPCLATEQYPEKLGPTHANLQPFLSHAPPGKVRFSCVGCGELQSMLQAASPRQIVVAGVETHVCVLQTCFDLLSSGYEVFVVADAVASRYAIDHDTALQRMSAQGVSITTTEAVLFEWCVQSGTPEFKAISQIVRRPIPTM